MKRVLAIIIFSFVLYQAVLFAQWPGYFYAFELKDSGGNKIDSASANYKMTTVPCNDCGDNIVMGISICGDNKTWRYYAGGYYQYLDNTNMLKIEKIVNGTAAETMIIEFPATLSGGKDKYYRNLYIGELKFKKGTYKIKLPETNNAWDGLKEIKLCPDGVNENYSFFDISKFQ